VFPLFATGVIDTGSKFAAGVVDTSANLPPVSTTLEILVAKLPLVSLMPVVHLDLQISPKIAYPYSMYIYTSIVLPDTVAENTMSSLNPTVNIKNEPIYWS
jgi:hypothetical protein